MEFVACAFRNFKVSDYSIPIEIQTIEQFKFSIVYQHPQVQGLRETYNYLNHFGSHEFERVSKSYAGFASSTTVTRNLDIRHSMNSNYFTIFQQFSNALWFMKDNSMTPYFTTTSSNEKIEPEGLRRNVYYSDSKGLYKYVEFSTEEIMESLFWFEKLSELTKKVKASDLKEFNHEMFSMSSQITFDIPSFNRAYYFLDSARKSDFLPAKIALYISVLETLLAVSGDNTHKTSERVAALLGSNPTEKWELYNQIKEAYNIRSGYVHGSFIKNKINRQLPDVSNNLDCAVRRVFKEMLLNFTDLNYENSNSDRVNKAFTRMILS